MDKDSDLESGSRALEQARIALAALADRNREAGDHRLAGLFDAVAVELEQARAKLEAARYQSW